MKEKVKNKINTAAKIVAIEFASTVQKRQTSGGSGEISKLINLSI